MRKNATKLAAAVLSLAMVMTSVNMPASAAKTKVKLNKTKATLYVNGSASEKATTLKVTVNGKKVNATFKSSNTKVLTVAKSGKVTAKKNGTAKVTATYKKKKYNCTVTVKTYATSVSITSAKTLNLAAGKTATIKATVKPSTASNKKVSFTSSNKNVATVTSAGKVTAKKAGTATVTVKALGSKKAAKKATVKVNVKAAVKPSTEPTTTPTTEPTATPETPVATEGAITVTTNVTGAAVKVVSGTAVVATASAIASESAIKTPKVANGTYTVVVSKDGYKETTKEVTVNGDTEVSVELEKIAEPTSAKVTAIGAKKIQVALDSPAADTSKAKITIKKGVVDVNVEKVTFSDDKKTALVETAAKLTKGDYVITVSGVATKDITSTLAAENEKVAKIDVTTKTAPFAAADNKKVLNVNYTILNQYGEDVTAANVNDVTWNSASGVTVAPVAANPGKLTLTSTTDFIPSAKVYLTGVHAKTGTVVNVEMTVGVESKADQVVFKGVYNTKTKKFENLPAKFGTTYKLVFDVNDQYGNKMPAAAALKDQLLFTSNNPLFVDADLSAVDTLEIGDDTYMAVTLKEGTLAANGGKVTIQVISKNTGKTATYEINADAASQVKKFTISAPDKMVAVGESVEIPFVAADQNGNAITKFADLNGKISFSDGLKLEENLDGTAKLVYTANEAKVNATDTTDAPVYLTSLVENVGNFSSVMINVKAKAKAVTVSGLTKDVLTNISVDNSATIGLKNIILQDQYGRTMSEDAVKAWLDASEYNTIVIASDYKGADDKSAFTVAIDGGSDAATTAYTKKTTDNTAKNIIITPKAHPTKASEKVTFSLTTGTAKPEAVAGSEKVVTFTQVAQSEFKSYEVDDLGTMYNNATAGTQTTGYDKTVKAYGVREDGTKVELKADGTYYTVAVDSDKLSAEASTGVISDVADKGYTADDFKDNGKVVTKTVKVNVTFYDKDTKAIVATVSKDLVLSSEAPKATTITLADAVKAGKFGVEAAKTKTIDTDTLKAAIKEVKDQYGVAYATAPKISISKVTKVDGSKFAVETNGTATASIKDVEKGDKFTATFNYGAKSVDVEFTVTSIATA